MALLSASILSANFGRLEEEIKTVEAAGVDWIHHRVLQSIREAGARASVALNPATPLCVLEHVLAEADMVLIMTVNPGFGGQEFISELLPKVRRCREMIDASGHHARLAVDGGVHEDTIDDLVEAGADVFVAGSAIFGGDDRAAAVRSLKQHLPAEPRAARGP